MVTFPVVLEECPQQSTKYLESQEGGWLVLPQPKGSGGLQPDIAMKNENGIEMGWAEGLDDRLTRAKKQNKKGKLVGTLGVLLGLVIIWMGFFLLYSRPLMYAGLGVIILAIVKGISIDAKGRALVKEELSATLIPQALGRVFQDVEYDPKGHISRQLVEQTDMGMPLGRIESLDGSDLVRARYRGMAVEFSDLNIKESSLDKDGNSHLRTVFQGQWLTCNFSKKLRSPLIVSEGALKTRKTVLTDNAAFNKRFRVEAENPDEVYHVLTPHRMECIQELSDRAGGKIYLHFSPKGKVHVAVNSGRDLFETGKAKNQTAETLRQRLEAEVLYLAQVVETLG